MNSPAASRHAYAWIFLTAALACHVLDEAAHGFLSVYNPAVLRIRTVLPWLPVPSFTFSTWIAGLTLAVVVLMILSRFAFLGRRWIVLASYLYAAIMTGNGLGHIAGSVYARDLMPGVYSSPLLLAASAYLLWTTWRTHPVEVRAPAT